jgi:ABC-type multidrug transport system permease subunit
MERLLWHFKNLGRITFLELIWGMRVPESVVYNFLAPSAILILLGLMRSNPDYLNILVPGLIAMTIASSAMQGVGTSMSFMRAYGSWRTLQASPIPPPLYFAGLIGSRLIRIILIVIIMLLTSYFLLGYRMQGNFALTFLYVLLGTFVFAALGLVIAYVMSSPQAVSGALNFLLLPMIFTSGVLFVSQLRWVKTVSLFFPLTFLVDLIRSNASGQGPGQNWLLNVGVLIVWLVLCSWAALWLARKRVEEK